MIATDQWSLLRCLKSEYKVRPAILGAVESKALRILTTIKKFMGRQEQLKKALSNNTVRRINEQFLMGLLGTGC